MRRLPRPARDASKPQGVSQGCNPERPARHTVWTTYPPATCIGDNDLGGVVTGPHGAEAGVWMIAETTDLPTKCAKIVVTDEHGRCVMPDLPKTTYRVWVRGYGLVDAPKGQTTPGSTPERLTALGRQPRR